jgi:hypothetical protein
MAHFNPQACISSCCPCSGTIQSSCGLTWQTTNAINARVVRQSDYVVVATGINGFLADPVLDDSYTLEVQCSNNSAWVEADEVAVVSPDSCDCCSIFGETAFATSSGSGIMSADTDAIGTFAATKQEGNPCIFRWNQQSSNVLFGFVPDNPNLPYLAAENVNVLLSNSCPPGTSNIGNLHLTPPGFGGFIQARTKSVLVAMNRWLFGVTVHPVSGGGFWLQRFAFFRQPIIQVGGFYAGCPKRFFYEINQPANSAYVLQPGVTLNMPAFNYSIYIEIL